MLTITRNPYSRIEAAGCSVRINHHTTFYLVRAIDAQGVELARGQCPRTGSLDIEQVRARAKAGGFGPCTGMHQVLTALAEMAEAEMAKHAAVKN